MNGLKKLIPIISLIFACMCSAYAGDSVEEQLLKIANETRKNLPMQMDANIQATSIGVIGKMMIQYYTFTRKSSSIKNLDDVKAAYYKSAVNSMCTTPDVIDAFKQGVSVQQTYFDIDGGFVMQYVINKNTCKNIR